MGKTESGLNADPAFHMGTRRGFSAGLRYLGGALLVTPTHISCQWVELRKCHPVSMKPVSGRAAVALGPYCLCCVHALWLEPPAPLSTVGNSDSKGDSPFIYLFFSVQTQSKAKEKQQRLGGELNTGHIWVSFFCDILAWNQVISFCFSFAYVKKEYKGWPLPCDDSL